MPAMGDSVSEGTILEWHKQEGDSVSEDETIVEISTDKVDAEVPSPATGTVVKVHAAEGDTVHVGALLAEITLEASATVRPSTETWRRSAHRGRGGARRSAEGEAVEITMPAMGESVSEGVILEWAKQPGDQVEEDETIVEISTDKVDAEVPAPASGVMGEILADPGDTVTVGQVIGRMKSGRQRRDGRRRRPRRGARRAGGAGGAEEVVSPTASASRPSRAASPPPRASTSPNVRGSGPAGRIRRPTCSRVGQRRRRRRPPRTPRSSRAPRRCSPATWTSRGRSRPPRRSARSPSRCSTRAARSSRTPATRSPSPI